MDEHERPNGHSNGQVTLGTLNGRAPGPESARLGAGGATGAAPGSAPPTLDIVAPTTGAAAPTSAVAAPVPHGTAGRSGEVEAAALAPHLVALLFAADEPLDVADAARILGARKRLVEQAIELLLDAPPTGLILQRHGDQLQLATGPSSAPYVRRLRGLEEQARLSRAALEVLAIVAYRQPITRAEIEAVRGVGGDRALATLLQRELIEEVGRKETVGRPVLFGTTLAFLEHLGLRSLADLPPVPGLDRTETGETLAVGDVAQSRTLEDGIAPVRGGTPVH